MSSYIRLFSPLLYIQSKIQMWYMHKLEQSYHAFAAIECMSIVFSLSIGWSIKYVPLSPFLLRPLSSPFFTLLSSLLPLLSPHLHSFPLPHYPPLSFTPPSQRSSSSPLPAFPLPLLLILPLYLPSRLPLIPHSPAPRFLSVLHLPLLPSLPTLPPFPSSSFSALPLVYYLFDLCTGICCKFVTSL